MNAAARQRKKTVPTITDLLRFAILDATEHGAMSQADLARLSGVSEPVISKFIHGHSRLTLRHADLLCRALRITPRGPRRLMERFNAQR